MPTYLTMDKPKSREGRIMLSFTKCGRRRRADLAQLTGWHKADGVHKYICNLCYVWEMPDAPEK